jgi:hypothetical protein
MATLQRSRSCSFIPQDLPISELFSDIVINKKNSQRLEKELISFVREFSQDYQKKMSLIEQGLGELNVKIQNFVKVL